MTSVDSIATEVIILSGEKILPPAFPVIRDGETMRLGIGEQDLTTIAGDRLPITDETLRLMLRVLDHAHNPYTDERITGFPEDTLRHSMLQKTPVHRDDVGHRPLRMPDPTPQDLLERSQVVTSMLSAKEKFPIRILVRRVSGKHRHDTDRRASAEMCDIVCLYAHIAPLPDRCARLARKERHVVNVAESEYGSLDFVRLFEFEPVSSRFHPPRQSSDQIGLLSLEKKFYVSNRLSVLPRGNLPRAYARAQTDLPIEARL